MKLSIITINYNDAIGLEKTVESVISQSYNDYEYIVIDGGSNDDSKNVLIKYDQYITYWVSEPDRGIYNAMNKGIEKAKGKYLHFLNSGDFFTDSTVLCDFFQGNDLDTDIIRGNYIYAQDSNSDQERDNFGEKGLTLKGYRTQAYCHQAMFLKKNLFDRFGLYDESYKIASDWKHTLICILHNVSNGYIDRLIVKYDANGISSNTKLQESEFSDIWNNILPDVIKKDYECFFEQDNDIKYVRGNYLTNFLFAHKFPQFLLKVLRNIYVILGI